MASRAGNSGFRILVETLSHGVNATIHAFDDVEDDLRDVMENMVEDAKAEAPWADNTGSAREGLDASIDHANDTFTITLYHTVDYGQWLETIQSGQYAIIMPTIEKWAPEILKAAGDSLSGKG